MKRLWIASGLLIVLLAASLVNSWYAGNFTSGLSRRLEQAQALTKQDEWDQAEQITRQVFQDWERGHFYLHVFMRHSDTDQILRAFHSVLQYLELEEMDQYAAANADLVTQLELLSEMEQPTLVNVL